MAQFKPQNFMCMPAYGCGPGTQACARLPVEGDPKAPWLSLGPWVNVCFCDQKGVFITVGNQSTPSNKTPNTAVIKSFQYGQSDGTGAEVEIYDEEGGSFINFVDKVAKTPGDALTLYKAIVRWGWSGSSCGTIPNPSLTPIQSAPHTFALLSIDINIQARGVLFKLEMQDLMEPLFDVRPNETYTGTLKQAITSLFKAYNIDVEFAKLSGSSIPCKSGTNVLKSGNRVKWFFKEDKLENDTSQKWQTNGLTPLAAARQWISNYRTKDDKGIIPFWDNSGAATTGPACSCFGKNVSPSKPKVVFLEDPKNPCPEDAAKSCNNSLGTYIVNGGAFSPVLSFDPKIKFNFSAAARTARAIGSQTTKTSNKTPEPCKGVRNPINSGTATMVQISEDMNRIYGPKQAQDEANLSQLANERANQTYENIEAELKIQGDPSMDDPFGIRTRTVSIIVINPFHLRRASNRDCPEWLVAPPCNSILSNKNWFINGISHDISAGSYTTTLKLFLPAPGKNVTLP